MAARKWTVEQRQAQAEKIRAWKPWEHSTGPISDEGKAKVLANAFKGGQWKETRELIKAVNTLLRHQKNWIAK